MNVTYRASGLHLAATFLHRRKQLVQGVSTDMRDQVTCKHLVYPTSTHAVSTFCGILQNMRQSTHENARQDPICLRDLRTSNVFGLFVNIAPLDLALRGTAAACKGHHTCQTPRSALEHSSYIYNHNEALCPIFGDPGYHVPSVHCLLPLLCEREM